MPRFTVSSEAYPLFAQTLDRAASRDLLLFEYSNEKEAKQAITEVFYAAAGVREMIEGCVTEIPENRYLDLAEARLAIATLNMNADGDRLVTAGEAWQAEADIADALQIMTSDPLSEKNKIAFLTRRFADRAVGWRRISRETVSREIRGVFHMPEIANLDPRPGLDPIDVLLAAIALNHEAGGAGAEIRFKDALRSYTLVENAMAGLKTFYRQP